MFHGVRIHWTRVPLAKVCWLIFLIALSLRVFLVLATQSYREEYKWVEHVAVARALYHKGTFSDPFGAPTGPTAFVAPAYPFVLSLVYRLTGDGLVGEFVKRCLSSGAASAQYAMLPVLASASGMTPAVGVAAGLFGALFPFSFYTETTGHQENPYLALALVLLSLMSLRLWQRQRFTLRTGLWHGFCWGVGLLLNPVLLPCLLGFSFAAFWAGPREARSRYFRYSVVMVTVALGVTAPWIIRNYIQLGGLVPLRDNYPLEFLLSNHPAASINYRENLAVNTFAHRLHPNDNPEERRRVRSMGELAYMRMRGDEAIATVRSAPGRFLRMTALRMVCFWFPISRSAFKTVVFWVVTAAALVGMVRLARTSRLPALLFGALLIAFPLTYYPIQIAHRYRYPMDWALLLLAAYLLVQGPVASYLSRRLGKGGVANP